MDAITHERVEDYFTFVVDNAVRTQGCHHVDLKLCRNEREQVANLMLPVV